MEICDSRHFKVDKPNSVTPLLLIGHLYWTCIWSGLAPTTCIYIYIKHVFKRDWTMCSKYDHHSRFTDLHKQREGEGLYDQFIGLENLYFDNK